MRCPLLLPMVVLLAFPLAAQVKPGVRPPVRSGPRPIGPKPDDPARNAQGRGDGMKPTGGRGPQAIGPKPDDPARNAQGRGDGMKPTGGRGPQAIGPKPDDPARNARPAPRAGQADPRAQAQRR